MNIEAGENLLAVLESTASGFVDTRAAAGAYYYYTVTALNRLSNESAPAPLVSNDTEPPVVRTRDLALVLANGTASLQAADLDGGSSDNWGIEALEASRGSFGCGDIGPRQVHLTALDRAGLRASAPATVQVQGRVPQPAIALGRSDATPTGRPVNTIVLGYGAQVLELAASDADPATRIEWRPAAGLSTSGALAHFAPIGPGTFALDAQAVSANGCPAPAALTVSVIDARCGDGKVAVCHVTGSRNSQPQLCVASAAVPAMLRRGDRLGSCGQ